MIDYQHLKWRFSTNQVSMLLNKCKTIKIEEISVLMEIKYDRLPTSQVEILHQSGQLAFNKLGPV